MLLIAPSKKMTQKTITKRQWTNGLIVRFTKLGYERGT